MPGVEQVLVVTSEQAKIETGPLPADRVICRGQARSGTPLGGSGLAPSAAAPKMWTPSTGSPLGTALSSLAPGAWPPSSPQGTAPQRQTQAELPSSTLFPMNPGIAVSGCATPLSGCSGTPLAGTLVAAGRLAQQSEDAALEKSLALAEEEKMELLARLEAQEREAWETKVALAEAKAAKAEANLETQSIISMASRGSLGSQLLDPALGSCIGQMRTEQLDSTHYDLVIIGGGPVGVAAAVKCAFLGHRAIIVDKPKLPPRADGLDLTFGGPTGLFSKAMRDVAKHVDVPSLQSMHLDDEVIWHQVRNMCLRLSASNASEQVKTLRNFKVDYLQAQATVISGQSVMVQRLSGEAPVVLTTDHVLIATGSKPMRPKEIPFDDVRIFDSDTINTLSFLPSSVAIMGAGVIAIEYAKIFRKMGVKVYMLVRSGAKSALERLGLDPDIADKLVQVLHEDDVDIFENTTVQEYQVPASRQQGPLSLCLKSSNADVPAVLNVDVFLAAAGRVPNTNGWGAEKLNMKLNRGALVVDDSYQTSVKGIFAAGDVIGPPSLASTGVYQAQAAVLEVFDEGHLNKYTSFPIGMWTTPECGYFGLTSAAAKKEGMDVEEGCVEYSACLRGRVFAPCGLMKLVFKKADGVIVGVHILGEDACELVHYGMDLVVQGVNIFKVMTTCFTAVTFHELFKEAALNGNSKLEFGLEWHKILDIIGTHIDNHEHPLDLDKMKTLFEQADEDGNGSLDEVELMHVFQRYGVDLSRATVHNLVRLADSSKTGKIHLNDFFRVFDILEEVRSASHFGSSKPDQAEKSKPDTAEKVQPVKPQDAAPPIAGA